jgi:riboflavin transporter FmnP
MERTAAKTNIKKIVVLGMFAALAYVVHFVHIPIMFLNLDFKDIIITVAGLYFGPLSGILLAFVVPLLELLTVGETGIYGFIMNVISSLTFVGVSSMIYRFKKTFVGAIVGLVCGALSMTAVMMVANLLITPYYMHADTETVAKLIPTVLLPFNAIKGILNAALTLCLYKPMTRMIKALGFGKIENNTYGAKENKTENKRAFSRS